MFWKEWIMDHSKIDIRKFECVAVFFPNFIWASNDPNFVINYFSTSSSCFVEMFEELTQNLNIWFIETTVMWNFLFFRTIKVWIALLWCFSLGFGGVAYSLMFSVTRKDVSSNSPARFWPSCSLRLTNNG